MLAATIGTIVLIAIVSLFVSRYNPRGDFWGGVEPPKAQCEAYAPDRLSSLTKLSSEIYSAEALNRLVREPQNTVTNLAYAVAGVVALSLGVTPLARSFALACVFLAFGSGMYHASLLPEWRLIDMMGVYAVLFSLALCGLTEVRHIRPSLRTSLLVAGGTWVLAFWCTIHRNDFRWWGFKPLDSTTVVLVMIGLNSGLVLYRFTRFATRRLFPHWTLLGALAVFGPLAGAGGQGDRFRGFWADPQAIIQGHSVWHVAGGAALLLAFGLFYLPQNNGASEKLRLGQEQLVEKEKVA
ncbi:MAG TPA: hypothetical protein VK163_03180 [Opitutaceae bacterium]|nr:hypothetical protein [Opitutaceae bacterium]